MRRNNTFNKIFHRSEIRSNFQKIREIKLRQSSYDYLYRRISNSTSLIDLINLHKEAYADGYRNTNLSPCSYGMFRTSNILKMQPSEVFLGGIYGLHTFSISEWENHKNELYGQNGFGIDPNTTIYSLLVNTYKHLLLSNIQDIHNKELEDLKIFKNNNY